MFLVLLDVSVAEWEEISVILHAQAAGGWLAVGVGFHPLFMATVSAVWLDEHMNHEHMNHDI